MAGQQLQMAAKHHVFKNIEKTDFIETKIDSIVATLNQVLYR